MWWRPDKAGRMRKVLPMRVLRMQCTSPASSERKPSHGERTKLGMKESAFWRSFKAHMEDHLLLQRIESSVGVGIPDVHYHYYESNISGWIELKVIEKYPAKPNTPVRVDHYSNEQRIWHKKWRRAGARVFVLLRVDSGPDFWLFDAAVACGSLGLVSKSTLETLCLIKSERKFPADELLVYLARPAL